MSDAKLIQAIIDYRRGAIRVYDGPPGSPPRMGRMPEEYKNYLLGEIETAIGERGGRFVHEKILYQVHLGKILTSVAFF